MEHETTIIDLISSFPTNDHGCECTSNADKLLVVGSVHLVINRSLDDVRFPLLGLNIPVASNTRHDEGD